MYLDWFNISNLKKSLWFTNHVFVISDSNLVVKFETLVSRFPITHLFRSFIHFDIVISCDHFYLILVLISTAVSSSYHKILEIRIEYHNLAMFQINRLKWVKAFLFKNKRTFLTSVPTEPPQKWKLMVLYCNDTWNVIENNCILVSIDLFMFIYCIYISYSNSYNYTCIGMECGGSTSSPPIIFNP